MLPVGTGVSWKTTCLWNHHVAILGECLSLIFFQQPLLFVLPFPEVTRCSSFFCGFGNLVPLKIHWLIIISPINKWQFRRYSPSSRSPLTLDQPSGLSESILPSAPPKISNFSVENRHLMIKNLEFHATIESWIGIYRPVNVNSLRTWSHGPSRTSWLA